jgi:pimeloyl-ACP methyl ester carboxylesterase
MRGKAMRAREPDLEAYVASDGVRVGYEVFGDGEPTLLLVPAWTIVHSRVWKLQVPYLARHFRVLTIDRPGNRRSDRPLDAVAHRVDALVDHALAVLDATATDCVVLVSLSQGARETLKLAAEHADRVLGAIFIAPTCLIEPGHPERLASTLRFYEAYPPQPEGWERLNARYWLDHYEDFAEFFFSQCFPERHSTKQHEDCAGWAGETTPEVLLASVGAELDADTIMGWATKVSVPTLVIHGDNDRVSPLARAETLAQATHGDLVVLEGAGHIPLARDPVRVNLLIRDFVDRVALRSRPRRTGAVGTDRHTEHRP